MGKTWPLAGAAVLVAAAGIGVVIVSSAKHATTPPREPANTATVQRGALSDQISQSGTLTYRARADGSAYAVFNRAIGTYTRLPVSGSQIDCGSVLYRVNDRPVVLLCGSTPAYRSLSKHDSGPDVTELNASLVRLGYATPAQLDPSSDAFSAATASAVRRLQAKLAEDQTGSLALGQVVFLPEAARIASVSGEPGALARPGALVLSATSDTLEVQLALAPSQQGEVRTGDRAQVTLPDNMSVTGRVDRLGRVAQLPAGQNTGAAGATIPAYISLDHPQPAGGLDRAPVQVNITTKGVQDALSVPVTAIVGRAGGGFAVEVVRADGRRESVPVKLGLFDTAGGRVQVDGDLHVGDRVAVGSS